MPKMPVFINAVMNVFRCIPDPQARKVLLKKDLLDKYEWSLNDAKLERYLEQHASSLLFGGVTPFMPFYQEARELYSEGYFYSCICVCGITYERIEREVVHRVKARIGAQEYRRRKREFKAEGRRGTARFLAHLGAIR